MTGADIAQIITSVATLIAAVGAIIIGLRSSKQLDEVHHATNGMKTQLEAVARAEGHAAGIADEKATHDSAG